MKQIFFFWMSIMLANYSFAQTLQNVTDNGNVTNEYIFLTGAGHIPVTGRGLGLSYTSSLNLGGIESRDWGTNTYYPLYINGSNIVMPERVVIGGTTDDNNTPLQVDGNNGIKITTANTGIDGTHGQITINNTSSVDQSMINFLNNGNDMGRIRSDYDGNITFGANSGFYYFQVDYTGTRNPHFFVYDGTNTHEFMNADNSTGNVTFPNLINANQSVIINNLKAPGNAQIYFENNGSLDWDLGAQVGEATQNFNLYNRGTSSIALSVNKATNVTSINSRLLIAGSPDDGNTPLQLNGPLASYNSNNGIYSSSGSSTASGGYTATYIKSVGNNTNGGYGLLQCFYSGVGYTAPLVLQQYAGNVGIGTTNPQSKLAVNGAITAQQVTVTQAGWSDFVFDKDYRLKPLSLVANYITRNNHLPGIPSSWEIESTGLNLGEMQQKQMQKIEELMLYAIEQDKRITGQDNQIKTQRQQVAVLNQLIGTQQQTIERQNARLEQQDKAICELETRMNALEKKLNK